MLSTVVIVGHSHTVGVQKALAARNAHWAAPEWLNVRVINLREFMPSLGLTTADVTHLDSDGPPRLHARVVAEIDRQIVANSRTYFVSMIGGNVHNVLGLMRAEVPFDFVLPEAPDLPLEPGARVIPYGAIRSTLERRLRYDRGTLEALRRQCSGVLMHLESPPPPIDDEFVLKTLHGFADLTPAGNGVVSAAIRYKMWRLHSTIVEKYCHELGIIFVQAPIETRDGNGYLVRQAYANATHANSWYASRVLGQLEAIVLIDQSEKAA